MIKQFGFNEAWFKVNQSLLLWMANTDYGRDLLCIDQDYPRIIKVAPDHLKCRISKTKFLYDFRTHNKWSKVIKYRWKEFCFLSKYYGKVLPVMSLSRVMDSIKLAAVYYGPFYPDAGDPGTNTWDGLLYRNNTETFASIVAGAGTGVLHSTDASGAYVRIDTPNATQWNILSRAHLGFHTASIVDSETINIATLSLYGVSKTNLHGWNDSDFGLSVVSHTPGSNTTGVASDYNVATFGSTKLAGDLAYSSFTLAAYNDLLLNSSGRAAVSKTGVTNLGVRMPADISGSLTHTGVTGQSNITGKYADESGTSSDPKLTVVTDVAGTGISGVIKRHDCRFTLGVEPRDTTYTFPLIRMEDNADFYIEDFIPVFTNHGTGTVTFRIVNADKSYIDYDVDLDGDEDPGGIGIDYTDDSFKDIIYTNSLTAQETRKEIKPMEGSSTSKEIILLSDDDNFPFSLTDIFLRCFAHK